MKLSILTQMLVLGAAASLAACGGGSGSSGDTNPVPSASLAAAATTIAPGGSTTLTWSSTNATACTASGGWSGSLAASGSQSTGAVTAATTYSLTCSGPGGTSGAATATVTVAAVPTATLAATASTVAPGGSTTLNWNSTNATACTATGGSAGWAGAKAASGSQSTGALAATTTFSLTCSGAGGTSPAATVTVTANPVPTAQLTAAAPTIGTGGSTTLTWTSTNATACAATGGSAGWAGAKAPSGSQSTGALTATTTYSLTCSGAAGTSPSATATVTVTPNPVPTVTLTAFPGAVVSGGTATLTWSSANATSCTATGPASWAGTKAVSGSQSTGALTSAQTFSLACSGPGGSSAVATVPVRIASGAITVTPRIASIPLSRAQQFTATVPGGGTASWSVDGVSGGNATVGAISATGLYTAGTAPGTHSIVATDNADPSDTAAVTVAVTDLAGVFTYHNDLGRDGANVQEYALTTGNVNTNGFGKLTSCPVDGAIYAQPLWVPNLTVNGATHNVVIVATQHDSVYAFDADASPCVQLWTASLVDTGHGGTGTETSVPGASVGQGSGDISPEVGITSTPVIDPATGTLYVHSKSIDASQTFHQRLHALDYTTGNERTGSPVTIAATVQGIGDGGSTIIFNNQSQAQRPGLALVNGVVYIAWASHEDAQIWHGWVMGYHYANNALTQTGVFNSTPNGSEGGIWMSGGAPAADSNGNLYVITGNGTFDANVASNVDYGDSLLQLNVGLGGALSVGEYFTPSNQAVEAANDEDFGSGGTAVLADLPTGSAVTHLVLGGGKDGNFYVLNRDSFGGYSNGTSGFLQEIQVGYPIFSTPAFWNNYFFLGTSGNTRGPLYAYQLNTATAQFSRTSQSPSGFLFPGTTPSVSASGTQNGIVWTLDNGAYCTTQSTGCGPAVLHAYDATNLGSELWNSSQSGADAAGYAVKFTVPTVANGKVYVGTRGNNAGGADASTSTPGELDIYALKP